MGWSGNLVEAFIAIAHLVIVALYAWENVRLRGRDLHYTGMLTGWAGFALAWLIRGFDALDTPATYGVVVALVIAGFAQLFWGFRTRSRAERAR